MKIGDNIMTGINYGTLIPIIIYFIGIYASKHLSKVKSGGDTEYMEEYMTGGRDTGVLY